VRGIETWLFQLHGEFCRSTAKEPELEIHLALPIHSWDAGCE
jgi:hypothetical protein